MERTYNIPLRKEYQKVAKHKRSKKAVTALKQFLSKHMKSETVKIGRNLNEFIWEKGIKNLVDVFLFDSNARVGEFDNNFSAFFKGVDC